MDKKKIIIVSVTVVVVILSMGFLFYQNYQITNSQDQATQNLIDENDAKFEEMDQTNNYVATDPEATAKTIYTASYNTAGPTWADAILTNWDAYNAYNMLTEPAFDEVITNDTSGEYKVVYFFQYGCSHCEKFLTETLQPTYDSMLNTENFYVYNAEYYGFDRLQQAAGSDAGTPTVAVYKDGQVETTFTGPSGGSDLAVQQEQFKAYLAPYGFFE